ncbi:MAG: hypothetical protein JST47_00455 [Bacteroidetes bacterium]|nr:hypothetical protein [Bacteroidota bacterium]MBS1972817.1 hypothetical protein [Bacteroidota bacterium]
MPYAIPCIDQAHHQVQRKPNIVLVLPGGVLDGQPISAYLTTKNDNKPHWPIYYYNIMLEGVRDGEWKLRVTESEKAGALYEMYNLSWGPSVKREPF